MPTDQSPLVLIQRQGPVLAIRFNRPDKKNALTRPMYRAVTAALRQAETDPTVRIILFGGVGDCFAAGHDLHDFLANPEIGPTAPGVEFLSTLTQSSKILVAGIQGAALGIGCTMLLHCDLVIAAAKTRLHLPFVNLALVPEAASSRLLPWLIGHHRAAELLLLGEAIDAEAALDLGLVNRVVTADALDRTVADLVTTLAAKPPNALGATKRLIRPDPTWIADSMAAEYAVLGNQLQSPELKQAIAGFFSARKPG